MRTLARLLIISLLLSLGAAAAPATRAQAPPPPVHLPLLSTGCAGAAICAALEVGPTGGICCIGGRPGQAVTVPIRLQALSSAGLALEQISDHQQCAAAAPIDDATWEPYVAGALSDTVTLPANWSTYSLRVRLRDAAGNLSPLLCDDVALEGYELP